MPELKRKLTYTQWIVLSFLAVIIMGTLLLMLPISSRDRSFTDPLTAAFTATSATCVTGLAVVDTYLHWSLFGQIVLLLLIQVGGLGFMTVMSAFAIATRRKISLHERTLLMQATGSMTRSGMVRLIRRILAVTFIAEFAGACLLAIRFIPQMGFWRGLWNALFHSVSAFCNAGFDLMGRQEAFSSFTAYIGDPLVTLTLAALITVGGLGFLVFGDMYRKRMRWRRFELHTKLVLTVSAVLTVGSWGLFWLFERNAALAGMPLGQQILAALFQAVTPRTAGFNTLQLSELSDSGAFLSVFLMVIGGSPGSTAGGIKTTTAAVLLLGALASSSRRMDVTVFRRRIDDLVVKRAAAIATVYITAVFITTLAICALEPFGIREILFEVASAVGTVGLTMGITPVLCAASRVLLILLMFAGRVGGLSLVLALTEKRKSVPVQRPVENILVG